MLQLTLIAVGRLGRGPEADLTEDYIARARKLPLRWKIDLKEIDDRRAPEGPQRKDWDEAHIRKALPDNAQILALDERGQSPDSPKFAQIIDDYAQSSTPLACIIGGPDGLSKALRKDARHIISFGQMTWPHKFVRAMLAEQLYRAGTILTGHPYHRI